MAVPKKPKGWALQTPVDSDGKSSMVPHTFTLSVLLSLSLTGICLIYECDAWNEEIFLLLQCVIGGTKEQRGWLDNESSACLDADVSAGRVPSLWQVVLSSVYVMVLPNLNASSTSKDFRSTHLCGQKMLLFWYTNDMLYGVFWHPQISFFTVRE